MKRAIFITLFSIMPTISMSQSMYKCTSPTGETSFQSSPCTAEQGAAEMITITPAQSIRNDNKKSAGQYAGQGGGAEEILDEYRRQNDIINSEYNQRQQEIKDNRCQYYRDRMAGIQDSWASIKRNGYRQNQKDYWQNRIEAAQRDVNRNCN